MEQWLEQFMSGQHGAVLGLIIVGSLLALGRGANWLVLEAVALSKRWGVPTVVIGATVVSLGTTSPEAAVSVLAAIRGHADLALGNAVGSIICDTGLILGLAALIAPLPLNRAIVNRQGWIQLGCGFLLVLGCLPYRDLPAVFEKGGGFPRLMGFFFLALLALYLWKSIRWAREGADLAHVEEFEKEKHDAPVVLLLAKLLLAIAIVVFASWVLIPAIQESAERIGVPESIIAATLVAFGTSLPELVTCVTAARQGHGELAIGNVIGADILNVLFVAGASAAVTRGGLLAPPHFFTILFPAMLGVLIVFRIGVFCSGPSLKRPFGIILLIVYALVTFLSYAHRNA